MMTRRSGLAAGSFLFAFFNRPLAMAADAWESAANRAKHSTVRLLAGGRQAAGPLAGYAAGLEIVLDTGFKTYWRDPGESGVPPVFDWTGSDNVERVEVIWPAPHRFPDGGGFSIGYKERVLLPLAIITKDAAKPVALKLKLDYAVCEKQCIPEMVQMTLALPLNGESPHIRALGEAMQKAPQRVGLNDFQNGLGLKTVSVQSGAKPVVSVEAVAPRYAKGLDLFIEAPNGAFFGAPKVTALGLAVPGNPLPLEATRFDLTLEQKPTGTPEWMVRLTLVSEDSAIEHSLRLDGMDPPR